MSETGIFVWNVFVLVYSHLSLLNTLGTSFLCCIQGLIFASIWFG